MKDMNDTRSLTCSDAQRDQIIEALPVLRDLEGSSCRHCGSVRYVLVFRISHDGRNGILTGRCSGCRNPRELELGQIERGYHA